MVVCRRILANLGYNVPRTEKNQFTVGIVRWRFQSPEFETAEKGVGYVSECWQLGQYQGQLELVVEVASLVVGLYHGAGRVAVRQSQQWQGAGGYVH